MVLHESTYRLDYYWKAISFYAVATLVYSVVRGIYTFSHEDGSIKVVLYDPIMILLLLFICGSAMTLLVNWWMRRSIVINNDSIVFRNRFRQRTIHASDIEQMTIGKEKRVKVRGAFKLIKIRLKSRRRLLRIRTSSFNNERELVSAIKMFYAPHSTKVVRQSSTNH